ncbi:hypothetical protein B296_00005137 [Ensete ventricosum]|uniref:Uncharacterized protein n=1 Tax=Ensete ventricosum TaxID=4639 RepID=A0A427A733_ENSVE|nr:hypothetical protein B296_00005137 [Ensete ventricosum]
MVIKSMIEAWLAGLCLVIEGITHFMHLLCCLLYAFCHWTTEPAVEKPVFVEVELPLKRLKKLGNSLALALKPKLKPALSEGSSQKEKGVAHLWSMRDLYQVKAQAPDKPYMAREIVGLPKLPGDSPLKARWASLTPRYKVWTDRANAGKLKDESSLVAITVAKARANEAIAKLEKVQHGEAKAHEKVKALEKELQGLKGDLDVGMAKNRKIEEFLLVAWAVQKKVKKDLAINLSAAPKKARVTIAHYKESPGFKSGLEKMGGVSYELEYKIALTRFRTKQPRLEVKEISMPPS